MSSNRRPRRQCRGRATLCVHTSFHSSWRPCVCAVAAPLRRAMALPRVYALISHVILANMMFYFFISFLYRCSVLLMSAIYNVFIDYCYYTRTLLARCMHTITSVYVSDHINVSSSFIVNHLNIIKHFFLARVPNSRKLTK